MGHDTPFEKGESALSENPTPSEERHKERGKRLRHAGFALLIASAVLWATIPAVPLLPVAGAWKIAIGGGIAVVGEVAFWLAAVVLGREVVMRYRRYLNPRNLGKGATRREEVPSRNGNEPLMSPARGGDEQRTSND